MTMSAKQVAADIVSAACTVAFNRSGVLGYGEPNTLREDIEKALIAEREACAKIAEGWRKDAPSWEPQGGYIADAIRARNNPSQ